MMHSNRRWCVRPVATPEELAKILAKRTCTLCSGFYVTGHEQYLFLNDSTHEDGAAEFGVIKGPYGAVLHFQLESVTFSWCTVEEAVAHIRDAIAGRMDESDFCRPVTLHLDSPEQHRHRQCGFCS
jgi:hypothetical protein